MHLIEVCLEGNESEVFLISLENEGKILVLASPTAKPYPQFTPLFIATGLLKTIQTNIAQQNQVPQPPI